MFATHPEQKFHWIRGTVNTHFDFLLDRGFYIVSVIFTAQDTDGWQVILQSDDCSIRVCCDHGKIAWGLSTKELLQRHAVFFDLDTVLELFVECGEEHKVLDVERKNEEQQIKEKTRLLKKYSDDVFQQVNVMSSFVLDHIWLISETKQNGRLSIDNRPFCFSANVIADFILLLHHRSRHHHLTAVWTGRLVLPVEVVPVHRVAGSRHGMPVAPARSPVVCG